MACGGLGQEADVADIRPLSRDKREAILNGAALVFADRGYEGASMSMITSAAGVSKGTIYQHFSGKADLFGAAVARECERSLARLFQPADAAQDLPSTLRDIGHSFVAMLASPLCLAIERTVQAEAERFPELAQAFFDAGPGKAIGEMARLLAAYAAAGDLYLENPAFAAEQFFMLCQAGIMLRCRLGMKVQAEDMCHAVEGAVAVFVRAYSRPR